MSANTHRTTGWPGRVMLAAAALLLTAGCSGGGGGNDSAASPPPAPPPAALSKAQLDEASRFAARASFGLDFAAIEALAQQGADAWLTAQFAMPVQRHAVIVDDLMARRVQGNFDGFETDNQIFFTFRRLAWWHRTVTADDVLRQRIAFALSEIFVVSDKVDALIIDPYALSGYYDTLLTHAFGNYRDLLRAVTLHPAMGIYLSHVNNGKADAASNTFPDENYAREVMQLFSIGLFELQNDGTVKLDDTGQPIATYNNDDIRQFARIFTGLSYGGESAFFGNPNPYFAQPMQMFDAFHEPGEKRLLNGVLVPAGQSGMADLDHAIDNLFNHANVGPFIGRQLIQRLVTSNPSPAYVDRVARVFSDNGSGVRGDLQAVIRAVLTDSDANAAPDAADHFGKLREPIVRYVSLLRQFNATAADDFVAVYGYFAQELTGQHPLSSPSVFNFFQPGHSPAGELAALALVAPEFQITTSPTVVGVSNLVDLAVTLNFVSDAGAPFEPLTLNFDDYNAIAGDMDALLDRLDTVLTHGTLSPETRQVVRDAAAQTSDPVQRVRIALYLLLISPDYAVRI